MCVVCEKKRGRLRGGERERFVVENKSISSCLCSKEIIVKLKLVKLKLSIINKTTLRLNISRLDKEITDISVFWWN